MTASGAPITKRRLLVAASKGAASHHASHARQDLRHGLAKFQCARCRYDAFWRPQEQRVVQQMAQPPERVAYGGWRQVQPAGCARHMALPQDGMEEDEQIQIDPR